VNQFCLACNSSVGVSGDWCVFYSLTLTSLPGWSPRTFLASYFFIISYCCGSQDMSCPVLRDSFSFSSLFTTVTPLYYPRCDEMREESCIE
jgi:hypothetical protein